MITILSLKVGRTYLRHSVAKLEIPVQRLQRPSVHVALTTFRFDSSLVAHAVAYNHL